MLPSPEVPFAHSSPQNNKSPDPPQRLHGFSLFFQQLLALLRKNILLSIRNKRATFLQLMSSLFFVFLIFCVDQAVNSRRRNTTAFKDLVDPNPVLVTAIPACETGYYIKNPCYDFIWSGNSIPRARTVVENIMKNNPGRPIPSDKVMEFSSISEVNKWLLAHPMVTTGALHFQETSPTVLTYGVQTNSTTKAERNVFEDPTFTFQIPLQLAAEREITRLLANDSNIEWSVAFKEFAHPKLQTFSVVGRIGPIYLLAATMFGFVIQMSNLVTEKELKLRQAMSVMGLMDSAFWLSWLLWEVALALISSVLIVLFGMMFQFYLFLNNNFGVLFFLFFLFQFNMVSFIDHLLPAFAARRLLTFFFIPGIFEKIGLAFLLSTFISNSGSARTVGFATFIVGFLTQLITAFGFPYDQDIAKYIRSIWSVFPPNLLAIGLQYLGDATTTKDSEGVSWAGRSSCPPGNSDCVITMEEIYRWLITTFFIWFVLALYFDNVLKDVNGVRKSWYYFLIPSYWTGQASGRSGGGICGCMRSPAIPMQTISVDEDVAAEEELVNELATKVYDPNVAVNVCGLVKTFPGGRGCCSCKSKPPYHAVKNLWVHMEKDKLFCLLGPNGAGKTTTINCLTGIIPVTAGDALVYGNSIRNTQGMANIRSYMGVCPQFDVLWDALTGLEHMYLFARIKGLPSLLQKEMSTDLLSQVKLEKDHNLRVGSYSGGMKRRLSVAISLIGDPKIVYLDEPTTGMDPISRRHVWDIIEGAKKGRAIVLTTHSMEEADVLSDRIAIMAKGKLRCIGTSLYLKSKFGSGYIVSVSLNKKNNGHSSPTEVGIQIELLKAFFKERLGVDPNEENTTFITFVIPRDREDHLMGFFEELEERQTQFGITDVQISLTTLEEVFLNIAKQAELESAAEEGRFETVLLPNGESIRVPIGASSVIVPGSQSEEHPRGLMIKLEWRQDERGNLCLASQSDLMPTPETELIDAVATLSGSRSRLTRRFSSTRSQPST